MRLAPRMVDYAERDETFKSLGSLQWPEVHAARAQVAIAMTVAASKRRRLAPAAAQPLLTHRCLASTLGASRNISSVRAASSKASLADRSIGTPILGSRRAMVPNQ